MVKILLRTAALVGAISTLPVAHAQTWQQHEFFQNSESVHAYFYSGGNVSGASKLELIDKKLPVDTSSFISAPNSLRLAWQSVPNGSWDVEIRLPNWPNRYIDFAGDTLYLWINSPSAIAAKDLPRLCLRDTANNFSAPLSLGDFTHEIPANKWQRIAIPLASFRSASIRTAPNPNALPPSSFSGLQPTAFRTLSSSMKSVSKRQPLARAAPTPACTKKISRPKATSATYNSPGNPSQTTTSPSTSSIAPSTAVRSSKSASSAPPSIEPSTS